MNLELYAKRIWSLILKSKMISILFIKWNPPNLESKNPDFFFHEHKCFGSFILEKSSSSWQPSLIINFRAWRICSSLDVEMVFCYQNCSDLLWEKNVLVIGKNFWNSRLKAETLQNFWDCKNNLSKQWKVRTIFGNRILFQLVPEGFSHQINWNNHNSNRKKIIGI